MAGREARAEGPGSEKRDGAGAGAVAEVGGVRRRARAPGRAALALTWAWVVPAGATWIVLQVLLPTRMEGARSTGLLAFGLSWLARLGDEHPLILGVGLFLAFSETARYWQRRWMRPESPAELLGSPDANWAPAGGVPVDRGGPILSNEGQAPPPDLFPSPRGAGRGSGRGAHLIPGTALPSGERSAALPRGARGARGRARGSAPRPRSRRRPARETLARTGMLVGAILLAVGARALLGEVHRVLGGSMAPTLNVGDRLLVNRLAYGLRLPFSSRRLRARAPRRGDVIVFPNPNLDPELGAGGEGADQGPRTLVKRVIGLPGDVIAFRDGSPVVNGWVVPSCDAGPYLSVSGSALVRGRLAVEVLGDRTYLTVRPPPGEPPTQPFEIPPGEVYVIGDDRGVSQDSRAWRAASDGRSAGIPIASIEGRVSRLAVGVSGDGRLDLVHPFAGLRPVLRQPNLDVTALERRIEGCLAHPPRSSTPPPAAARPGPQRP